MKTKVLILVSIIAFSGQSIFAQPKKKTTKAIFNAINELREDPQDYYKNHPDLFKDKKNATFFFDLVKPTSKLEWSDSLYMKAKVSSESNHRKNFPAPKDFCGFSGLGASKDTDQELIDAYIGKHFTTLLSPENTAIGIFCGEKKPSVFGDIETYAYIGRICSSKTRYNFPVEKKEIYFSAIDFSKLNTAAKSTALTDLDKEIITEINFARVHPKVYAQIIANHLNDRGSWLRFDNYIAGQEVVKELREMKPLNALKLDERLYIAAKKHGQDLAKRGYGGHTGSDNSSPFDRIKKALGDDYVSGSENLAGAGSARIAVINLLVDGGIGGRGHRYNIIDPRWTHTGCYFAGKVGRLKKYYVQKFAEIAGK